MIQYDEKIQELLENDDCKLLLAQVVMQAGEFWERAECHGDFCIQSVTPESIVFGSVNRVMWCPGKGFSLDGLCCTEKFKVANGWTEEKIAERLKTKQFRAVKDSDKV